MPIPRYKSIPDYDDYVACDDGRILKYHYQSKKWIILKSSVSQNGYLVVHAKKNGTSKFVATTVHKLIALAWLGPRASDEPDKRFACVVNHINGNKADNRAVNLEYLVTDSSSSATKKNIDHARKSGKGLKGYPVYQLDASGGIIAEFASAVKAGEALGIDGHDINTVCRGRNGRKTAGGFRWCFKESYTEKTEISVHGCSRAVLQYDLEGNFIARYTSLNEAAASIGTRSGTISNVCRGVQKTAGGYWWSYAEVEETDTRTELEKESDGWITLDEYPGYKISRDGRIYSSTYKQCMKGSVQDGGEKYVMVKNSNGETKNIAVHKLVALAYIPKPAVPDGAKLVVRHIVCSNPPDNSAENLKWVTYSDTAKTSSGKLRPVIQYNRKEIEVARYDSITDASLAVGVTVSSIHAALVGKRKSAAGSLWKYRD